MPARDHGEAALDELIEREVATEVFEHEQRRRRRGVLEQAGEHVPVTAREREGERLARGGQIEATDRLFVEQVAR